MSGRFLSKYLVSLAILLSVSTYATTVSINGHEGDVTNPDLTKGVRLQGIGDFFFKSGAYAKAVPYYEEALSLLPLEADITFRLAEIYQKEKLWRLSILYYEKTMELLKEPVNFGKSQQNEYIAEIRIAYIYHLQGDDKAKEMLREIRKSKSLLASTYPDAFEELKIFDSIYPEVPTRKNISGK